ncbi:MAG: 30S ribosomal protein S6 [Ignavibacteriales bacterium]|nr:30S ribosomal protein S6 [Ignavibacteriales bacterium]
MAKITVYHRWRWRISETEKWGRKRLAYTINKNRIGYYVIYRFEAPVDLIAELERLMKIDESVVRFLTIRLEKKLSVFCNKKFEAGNTGSRIRSC